MTTARPTVTLTPPHPETRTQLRSAAFFDLDRTLVAGSSGAAVLVEMYHEGILGRRALIRESLVGIRFRLWGIDDDTTDAVLARIAGYVQGVHHSRLDAVTAAALERIQPRVFPSIVARVRAHQQAGEKVYLITATSQEFADAFAATLDLDGAIGSRSEIIDGHYTGRPGGPFIYGEGKVDAITELAISEGLDLDASVAYSDSISDLPMLRVVGRPIAVNPDKELAEIARAEGWEILAVDHLAKRLRAAAAGTLGLGVAATVASILRRRATHAAR